MKCSANLINILINILICRDFVSTHTFADQWKIHPRNLHTKSCLLRTPRLQQNKPHPGDHFAPFRLSPSPPCPDTELLPHSECRKTPPAHLFHDTCTCAHAGKHANTRTHTHVHMHTHTHCRPKDLTHSRFVPSRSPYPLLYLD